MKKTITILAILLLSTTLEAQIVLKKSFDVTDKYLFPFYTSHGVQFCIISQISTTVSFYNADCSFYKEVTIPNQPWEYIYNISYFSDKLFNNDDLIEYLLFTKDDLNDMYCDLRVVNENNETVFNFGEKVVSATIYSNAGMTVININRMIGTDGRVEEIYSLPGSYLSGFSTGKGSVDKLYPNPSNSVVILEYKLPPNQKSPLKIYNSSGELVDQKIIDSNFDRIYLNVDHYKPGMYVYECNGLSNKFFVVK